MDPATLAFIAGTVSNLAKVVLDVVAEQKFLTFSDLLNKLKTAAPAAGDRIDSVELKQAVTQLRDLGLIKERLAILEDLNTISITASGLETDRKVRRLQSR